MDEINGIPAGISENKKLMYIHGGATFGALYKYKKGVYNSSKFLVSGNDGLDYDTYKEEVQKLYNKCPDAISYKFISNK